MATALAGSLAAGRPACAGARRRQRSARGVAARALSGHASMGTWERILLARRKQEVAVREEDYATAAEAKREVAALMERLPASKALMASLLDRLERQDLGEEDHVAAVQQLGTLGEWEAAPALARALHEGEAVAAAAEEALWQLFLRCPTPELQATMQQGVALMRRPECWDQALALFDGMVKQAPTFAEGYNKRATVLYLQQRYQEAIDNCKVALEMNPFHFKAAAGLGMCCAAVGDNQGAVAAYEHAVAINPRLHHLRTHIRHLRAQLEEERQRGQQGQQQGQQGGRYGSLE